MKTKKYYQQGQILVTLLIFMVVAITVTTAAVVLVISSSATASKLEHATVAYQVAESGAENGILRLLRNPAYAGETLTVGEGTATITVSTNGSNRIITSRGQLGNFIRTVEVTIGYNESLVLTVISWREVF